MAMTNQEIVLEKCDHLVKVGLWPQEQDLPYRRWLANFESNQQPAAAKLLDRLIYVNEHMAHDALASACQRLIRSFATGGARNPLASVAAMTSVHESIIVTPIRGEKPNPADSAYPYMRAARDQLGFRECQIEDDFAAAVDRASRSNGLVVLIDDIIGSGEQITHTIRGLKSTSSPSCRLACLAAVVTSRAYRRLTSEYPELQVFAGHVLDVERYGICSLLPESEHSDIYDLLHHVAASLQLPSNVDPMYGFKKFGLTLVFHNSIPDFSLPIFWASCGSAWTPLKERYQ